MAGADLSSDPFSSSNWDVYKDAFVPQPSRLRAKPWERALVTSKAPRLQGNKIWKKVGGKSQQQDGKSHEEAQAELQREGAGARKKLRVIGAKENIGNAPWREAQEEDENRDDITYHGRALGRVLKDCTPRSIDRAATQESEDFRVVPRKRTNTNHVITPRKPLRQTTLNRQAQTQVPLKSPDHSISKPSRRRKSLRRSSRRLTREDSSEPTYNSPPVIEQRTTFEATKGDMESVMTIEGPILLQPSRDCADEDVQLLETIEEPPEELLDPLQIDTNPLIDQNSTILASVEESTELIPPSGLKRGQKTRLRRTTRTSLTQADEMAAQDIAVEEAPQGEPTNHGSHLQDFVPVEDVVREGAPSPPIKAPESVNTLKSINVAEESHGNCEAGQSNNSKLDSERLPTVPLAQEEKHQALNVDANSPVPQFSPSVLMSDAFKEVPHEELIDPEFSEQPVTESLAFNLEHKSVDCEQNNIPEETSTTMELLVEENSLPIAESEVTGLPDSPADESPLESSPMGVSPESTTQLFQFESVSVPSSTETHEVLGSTTTSVPVPVPVTRALAVSSAETTEEIHISTHTTTTELTEAISLNAPLTTYDHDDTDMLRNFLTKVKANKAAKARKKSPGRKCSLPHSPLRLPLGDASTHLSPSPPRPKEDEFDLGLNPFPTSPARRKKRGDMVLEDEDITGPRSTRRSGRTRLPVKAPPGAPSFIPVRRLGQDGDTTVTLRRNEEKELAVLTRVNTRKNKGGALSPLEVLARKAEEKDDPVLRQRLLKEIFDNSQKQGKTGKKVAWAEELAQYQTMGGRNLEKEKEKSPVAEEKKKSAVRVGVRSKLALGAALNGTPVPKRRMKGNDEIYR